MTEPTEAEIRAAHAEDARDGGHMESSAESRRKRWAAHEHRAVLLRLLDAERERVRWFVDRAASGADGGPSLDGYRELGAKCAALEQQLDEARAQAEANRRDAEQGWAAFYALRKAVSADKYPTLTQIVRIKDAEAAMQEPGRG